jgi:hypothetical protein
VSMSLQRTDNRLMNQRPLTVRYGCSAFRSCLPGRSKVDFEDTRSVLENRKLVLECPTEHKSFEFIFQALLWRIDSSAKSKILRWRFSGTGTEVASECGVGVGYAGPGVRSRGGN